MNTKRYNKKRYNKKRYNKKLKTRKLKKRVTRKKNNRVTRKSKKQRGGYGQGSKPIGIPWNSCTSGANHYSLSPNGGAVGGIPAFSGNNKKQKGGKIADLTPQPILNTFRESVGGIKNTFNRINGRKAGLSSLPFRQNKQQN